MNSFFAQMDLLVSRFGSPFSGMMRRNQATRSNTPSGAVDQILHPGTPAAERNNRLWIVDRILEPQTFIHFIEFSLGGRLPSGKQTTLPLLSGTAIDYLQQPMSTWAPAPFDKNSQITMERIMASIGSYEDSSRLVSISKELHGMKARIWEGVMPISERRWDELQLDSPENFHEACQYLCAVTNVFHYLNIPEIKKFLRETYNIIWGYLDTFDKALQAKEATGTETGPAVSAAALWHEFIKDHYHCVSQRSHQWVTAHIERLRDPILEQLSNDTLINSPGGMEGAQFGLADKFHDLFENGAQADSAIFLPMDGYKGESQSPQDDVTVDTSSPYREQPIKFSGNALARKADYYCRLKYLTRIESWSGAEAGNNGSAATVRSQIRAQARTRAELRGEEAPIGTELWVTYANRIIGGRGSLSWGYIAYRTCYDHSDEQWEEFKKKFDQDISNWGSELQDVDDIRRLSKVEWRDAKESDIAVLRRDFETANAEHMKNFHNDIFLVADRAVIDSYLEAKPEQQGHVLAIDVRYDPSNEDPDRDVESPGYEGGLRILGSLLWDDLGPLLLLQTQHLADLWPLAQNDAQKIYRQSVATVSN